MQEKQSYCMVKIKKTEETGVRDSFCSPQWDAVKVFLSLFLSFFGDEVLQCCPCYNPWGYVIFLPFNFPYSWMMVHNLALG